MEGIETILRDILAELKALRTQAQAQAELRPFLTIDEVAELLRVSPKTIRNQLSSGRFHPRPTKIGGRVLFRAADLEAFGK